MKALIVDDEATTRRGLRRYIHWERFDIELVEEARDGEEALEKFQNILPDIVLSDIRMPNMDGITFSEKIHHMRPDCRIIFLSGYSDKEYLKAAIRLGAVSYVEKPINIPEIEDAISAAVEEIRKNRENEAVQQIYRQSEDAIQEKLFLSLMGGRKIDLELLENIGNMGIRLERDGYFRVLIVKLPREEAEDRPDVCEEKFRDVRRWLGESSCLYLFRENGLGIYLMCSDNRRDLENESQLLETLCQYIRDLLMTPQRRCFCAFGDVVSGVEDICLSYQNAVITLQSLFIFGYNKILFYKEGYHPQVRPDEEIADQFRDALKKQDREKAVKLVRRTCDRAGFGNSVSISYLKNLLFEMLTDITREIEQWSMGLRQKEGMQQDYVWELMLRFETVSEIQEYLLGKIDELFEAAGLLASENKTVRQAVRVLRSQYMREELTVAEVAEQVYVTPNYLSTLFKKEMGVTVSDYLTYVRVERAKELLRSPGIKLYEAARQVGYGDPNYFTKAFKRREQMTPSEYREIYAR